MAGLGFEMVRYADDMVVLCPSHEEAEAALEKLREWMAGAGLTLHPDKTRTVDMNLADSHFDFLGYRFKRSRRGKLMRLIRPKSMRKLRESIKPRTHRASGQSMAAIVDDLNRTLRGWFGYFKHAKANELGGIDGWIRMRLRSILRKRHGLKGRGRLGFGHSEADSGGGSKRRRSHYPGLGGEILELGGIRLHFAPQFADDVLA
jgi:RNA-directed DNA polymerase